MNSMQLLMALFAKYKPDIIVGQNDQPMAIVITIPLNSQDIPEYDVDESKAG